MKRQNLHCHTTFDDGSNSPEEMVLAAIRAGFGGLGVSLHCPIDGEEDWTCPAENEARFIGEMRRLREKYADRLAVWCGLEYDMDAVRRSVPPYDYIIGSCHLLGGIAIDRDPETAERLIACCGGAERAAQRYYERLSAMADYAEIAIVGHFDLFTKFNERKALYDTAAPACRDAAFAAMEKLSAAGKIFEINTGAISRGWRSAPYPEAALLRHLKGIGGRVTLSSDAHAADAIDCAFDRAEALASACGFRELWQFDGRDFVPEAII